MESNHGFSSHSEFLDGSVKDEIKTSQLVVDKIVLDNFKSYAGRHVLGPFHTRFSCIVGPNGSGKSNIIDAVLFVFGRRAYTFRHKKLVDLIHFSSHHTNAKYARVDVHLQRVFYDPGGQEDQVIPDSQFVLSREIHSDGSSKYFLNNKSVIYKEIVERLKPYGLDLQHNRFLISQGEVEQIAMLKPKGHNADSEGLLEYLEDVIGSSQYIPDIQMLEQQVQKITEQIQFKRDSLGTVQTQFMGMEGSVSQVKKICHVEKEVIILRSILEQKNLLKIKREIETVEVSQKSLQEEYEVWCSSREEKRREIHQMNLNVQRQDEIVVRAENMLAETEKEFSSLERLDNELAAKQVHCNKRLKTLQKEALLLEKEKQENEAVLVDLQNSIHEMKKKIPQEKELVEDLERQVEAVDQELQSEYAILRSDKEKAYQLLNPEKIKLADIDATLEMYKAELGLIEEKNLETTKSLRTLESQIVTGEQLYASKQDELKKTEVLLTQMKHAYDQRQLEMSDLGNQLKKERESLHQICRELGCKEEEFSNTRHRTMLIPSILRAKQTGILRGIIDRLWNLCEIDPKYHAAVKAVAGSEYILVEDAKDAEEVVSFVRQKKLGYITCIVMSHVRRTLSSQLANVKKTTLPEATQLLLSQIRMVDSQYEVAFFFVLRDVLVVDNLEVAQKIAFGGKKRWKVVTCNGCVIDKSGAMSGGGWKTMHSGSTKQDLFAHQYAVQVPSQLIDSLTSQKQIEQLRSQMMTIKESIASIQEKKSCEERQLTGIEESMGKLRTSRLRLTGEVDAALKDLAFYKKALKEHPLPELSPQQKKRSLELGQQIQLYEKKRTHQLSLVETKQNILDSIAKKIEFIGSGKRKKAFEAFLLKKKELDELIKNINAQELQVEKLQKRNITLTELLPENRKTLETHQMTQQRLEDERNRLTDQAELVLRKKEELEKILDEQKLIATSQHNALAALLEESKKADLQQVDYETKLHDLQQSHELWQHTKRKSEKKLSSLVDEWNAIPTIDDSQLNLLLQKTKKEVPLMHEEPPLKLTLTLSEEELDCHDEVTVSCQIKHLTDSVLLNKMDLSIIQRFEELSSKLSEKQDEYQAICSERDILGKELETKQLLRWQLFTHGFTQIAKNVKEIYQMLTHEGDAELELVDLSSPFTHGVSFSVRPPKKSWKRIQNLSGGEKTLSSLALVFALQNYSPTPLYFFDEIDAALDHSNLSTIALYVMSQARNAQFIVISLRNHMFELANRLFGIYKIQGSTCFTHIDPDSFAKETSKNECHSLRQLCLSWKPSVGSTN